MTLTRYTFNTRVAWVGSVTCVVRGFKTPDGESHTVTENQGWFVRFEGSQERMFLGHEEPLLKQGDQVRVTIEKREP